MSLNGRVALVSGGGPGKRKSCMLLSVNGVTDPQCGPIGLALAGRAGSRLATRVGVPVSRSTLLRVIRALPDPEQEELRQVFYGPAAPPNVSPQLVSDLDLLPDRPAQARWTSPSRTRWGASCREWKRTSARIAARRSSTSRSGRLKRRLEPWTPAS